MGILRKYYHKKGPPPPNFFIGGISSFISGTTEIASELGISFYKVKNFQTDGDNISFHIPSSMGNIPQLKFNTGSFASSMTYFYDIDGVVTGIGQDFADSTSNMERLWVPNCTGFDGPSGYHTLLNTGVKGFGEYPSVIGTFASGNMNDVFSGSKFTHLKYPNMTELKTQWINASGRFTHRDITTLERLYLPKLTFIDSLDDKTYSQRNFNLIPSGTIVYLNPFLETNRNSEIYITTLGVLTGDTITLNGLTYTATTGSTTGTQFNCTGTDIQCATNLATSINSDVRTGTLGDLITRHQYTRDYIIVKQTLSGSTGNTTTFSVSNATRLVTPTGSTFNYGGTVDRTVYYWETIRGAEIRYITGTTTPDAVVDLNGSNITTNSIDLTFTPPSSPDRPIDFYEVWINDGVSTGSTIWQDYLPHQEISGSTATVTELLSGTTYTFRVKAADTLYNVSDFSNTFTGTTL